MDPSDAERPVLPVVVSAQPAAAQEIREKPAEPTQPPAEVDPGYESGYGFGV